MRSMAVAVCALVLLAGCGLPGNTSVVGETTSEPATTGPPQVLRLATTTSTADTGLLEAILPTFEQRYNADVQVVAVGTGQALKLGENGDADVVLVHARAREDEFVAQGFGINRRDVMYNDFVVVGPPTDPAKIGQASSAVDAFARIAAAEAPFASRGDDSGTYTKEQAIWASAGISVTSDLAWYRSLGQGMGETLVAANEQRAYTLTDRSTFLAMRERLSELGIRFGGDTVGDNPDPSLLNPYGVIQVNPERHAGINAALAQQFVEWLISPETQEEIDAFGVERFGQPLFFPEAEP